MTAHDSLYFDAQIFGFLALGLVFVFVMWRYGAQHINRRLNALLITLAVAAMAVIAYGSFIEPRLMVVNQQAVSLSSNTTHTLRAAVISDIHVGSYKGERYVKRIVAKINEINPDAVFLLGDFVEYEAGQAEALAPLADTSAVYPTYAILGNHDYQLGSDFDPNNEENAAEIQAMLERLGIRVLKNEGLAIDDTLYIAGIDEIWTGYANIAASLAARSSVDTPTMLLTHNPDAVMSVTPDQQIGLVLAGHTHGGQIRLPFIGSVPKIPDQLGRAYDQGLFDYHGTPLFITSGIGESGPRARLFNPPEVVEMEIRY